MSEDPAAVAAAGESDAKYTLRVVIHGGHITGGGLSNAAHVVVSLNEKTIHTTIDLTSPFRWEDEFVQKFPTLEPKEPLLLCFSVYKKRWTSAGHKLVGSLVIPLIDFIPHANKGPLEGTYKIEANRDNLTLHGSLDLCFELTKKNPPSNSSEPAVHESPLPDTASTTPAATDVATSLKSLVPWLCLIVLILGVLMGVMIQARKNVGKQ